MLRVLHKHAGVRQSSSISNLTGCYKLVFTGHEQENRIEFLDYTTL